MKKSVLIVEDEKLMRDLLEEFFRQDGYQVYLAEDGVIAMNAFRSQPVDLVILDIMMPNMDGFSVCRRIRNMSDTLIVMLTAREEETDKLMGFELGADEYVTKPFSPLVLLARCNTLLQRFKRSEQKTDEGSKESLAFGKLTIDKLGYLASVDGTYMNLTKKEFDLLVLLAENKDRALSRNMILSSVWEDDYFGDGRVVDTYIKTLRKKLGKECPFIKTVVNVGYRFEV